MQKRFLIKLLCLTLLIHLSGCGFKLGSYHPQLSHKYPTINVPFSRDTAMHQALIQTLTMQGVKVEQSQNIIDHNIPNIKIIRKVLVQHPLVYALDGELRREQLKLTIDFEVQHNQQTKQISLTSVRERAIISRQRLAADLELTQIEKGMQKDIMQRLIYHLL